MSYNPLHCSKSKEDWQRRALAAEKTAQVLTHKVQSMYNEGGGQSAIFRQLERAKKREEENHRRRERIEQRAQELKRYNEHLEVEVQRRTRAIQTIQDNVTFGFLVIDQDLQVQEGFTRSCSGLFGRELQTGNSLAALLQLEGTTQHTELLLGVDQVFEDIFPEEVSLDQIPQRFKLNGRVLQVEGRVIRSSDDCIEGLLLTISDCTALEEAQRESRRNQILIDILKQKTAFKEFLDDTRQYIQSARAALATNQALVRRVIHTIKGNAASYRLEEVVEVAHRVESQPSLDTSALNEVEGALRTFLKDNFSTLGLDYDETLQHVLACSDKQMQRLQHLLRESGGSLDWKQWATYLMLRPAQELLGPIHTFVDSLAQRLGKEVTLSLQGTDELIDAELMRPIFRNLPHLIRNAVDHGLEASFERGDKSPQGQLLLSLSSTPTTYELLVQDDGRGINTAKLCERAIEQGLKTQKTIAEMTPDEQVQLIFLNGLSSAVQTSDISGRGIGMSAVLEAVQQVRGEIIVETMPNEGTRLRLVVPKPEHLKGFAPRSPMVTKDTWDAPSQVEC